MGINLPNDVQGAPLDFGVNAAQVFAQDAEADELYPAHEKHDGDERRVTRHVAAQQQGSHNDGQAAAEGEHGSHAANVGPDSQGHR